MTRVLITGSRQWPTPETIHRALTEHANPGDTIVHGACPTGADTIADEWATAHGFTVERHPPDWARHGKIAGPLRNRKMVELGARVCLAFPLGKSHGTRGTTALARRAGIEVIDFGRPGDRELGSVASNLKRLGYESREDRLRAVSWILDREVSGPRDLSIRDTEVILAELRNWRAEQRWGR